MIKVEVVITATEKADICNEILRALPEWFANEEPIIDYINKVQQMPFYAAYENGKAIGFVAIKVHNKYTAEVCVMGILKGYHRQGIGKKLISLCEDYCLSNQMEFLTVKTLDSSIEYEPYDKTRHFYQEIGFIPLEVFPLYWDKDNPCLLLAKHIGKHTK